MKLERALPGLQIVGVDDSFVDVDALDPKVMERIKNAKPDILLAALERPKQEIFAFEQRKLLRAHGGGRVGASLDFVAGVRKRAPRRVSSMGLEWFYRLIQEPGRLAGRYLVRDPKIPSSCCVNSWKGRLPDVRHRRCDWCDRRGPRGRGREDDVRGESPRP